MYLRELFPDVCPIEVEKNALVCNASWALLAVGSWTIFAASEFFVSTSQHVAASVPGASLAVWAILAAAVGWLLRLPFVQVDADVLDAASYVSGGDSEHKRRATIAAGILICGSVAGLNWLGCIVLKSESFLEAIPACTIILGAEFFILLQPSNRKLLTLLLPQSADHVASTTLNQLDALPNSDDTANENLDAQTSISNSLMAASNLEPASASLSNSLIEDSGSEDNAADDAIWSRTEFGKDEEGNVFAAGTITTEILPGETSRELVLGFTPAFSHVPSIEVELDVASMSVRQLNVTQTGARLLVRKPGSPSNEAVEFCLEWYAVEPQESPIEKPGISLP